jgi:acetyl-CoA C-acetyltransferase
MDKPLYAQNVYIIDGTRTPFLKARSTAGPFTAADLAVYASRALLTRQPFLPQDLDEVIMGCMMPNADEANIARLIGLRLGCGKKISAWTVQRNCASGLQSIDNAAQLIGSGRANLILAGGTEAMSHAPLLFNQKMVNWLGELNASKTIGGKLKIASRFRPRFLLPVIALLKGLTDSSAGLNMGQTAEIIAHKFHISRMEMDRYAVQSHHRLAQAIDQGYLLPEITPIYDSSGKYYLEDDGLRRDSSIEKLSLLKPFFDKKFGGITAGNSSQITDGAAVMILASQAAVKKYQLSPLAKIIDAEWAGVEPSEMGLGPVHTITPILKRQQLTLDSLDYMEINEAFAGQILACLAAWQNDTYCREELGLEKAYGILDEKKLNIDGGAIAIGHPVGASGSRLLLHTAYVLKRTQKKFGIASLCIGGGQGGAMLIENPVEG